MLRVLVLAFCLRAFVGEVGAQSSPPVGGATARRWPVPPEITAATATGDAAAVLALERQIEAAVVKGDVAFAETVLSSDFHFRHGDGWTRGEKTGGMEDDRAAFMKRIANREYLVHDLDNPKIEMHGDVAITWGRYVSLFMPDRNAKTPGQLNTIWFERVWAKRDGRWQWLSHRTVWGPHPSPAGIDPTEVSPAQASSYVPGLPAAKMPPATFTPQSKEAAELLEFERTLGAAVPGGDQALFDAHTSDDFLMWHGDIWTRGGRSGLIDTKQAFADRVKRKQYLAWRFDSQQAEMHGDVAVTFGRYTATLTGSDPARAWFAVWYERVYQKKSGPPSPSGLRGDNGTSTSSETARWMMLSQRTVHGATYGPTQEAVSDR